MWGLMIALNNVGISIYLEWIDVTWSTNALEHIDEPKLTNGHISLRRIECLDPILYDHTDSCLQKGFK